MGLPQPRFDRDAYLDREALQADKHEYLAPDVMVSCDEDDRQREPALRSPRLIVELFWREPVGRVLHDAEPADGQGDPLDATLPLTSIELRLSGHDAFDDLHA